MYIYIYIYIKGLNYNSNQNMECNYLALGPLSGVFAEHGAHVAAVGGVGAGPPALAGRGARRDGG